MESLENRVRPTLRPTLWNGDAVGEVARQQRKIDKEVARHVGYAHCHPTETPRAEHPLQTGK